ncbi:MAG: non-canonical purine NTP pyrophosphatase, partial [Planctomycetota bacterium]
LADPQGNVVLEATGRCHGRIAMQRVGQGGFGYDPLFIVDEYHKTFGEMGDAVKSAISHRSRALYAFLPQLLQLAQKQK